MLPIGLNMCSPADQELINLAKIRYSLVPFMILNSTHSHILSPSIYFYDISDL